MLTVINSFSQENEILVLKPGPVAGKDVLIRSVYPTINEGDHFDFMSMAGTISSDPFVNRSLIEFDFSDIPDQSIIVEAKLSLYYSEQTGGPGHQGENESYLYKITEDWDENTVTWNTQPSITFDNPVYLPTSSDQFQDYLDIDVTEMIIDLFNYPDLYHGFMIRLINEEPYRTMTFSSSDQNNPTRWPELEVTYIPFDAPIAFFTYEIDENFNVIFNNQSENYDSSFWNFGNGYYSSIENPVIQYNEEGIYFVTLTVFNQSNQSNIMDTVYYCHDLIASFEYTSNGSIVSFINKTDNSSSYLWDFGDGFFSYLENPVYTFPEYSDYYVCLIVTSQCFEETYCDTVKVEPAGINDLELKTIDVFPNPFNNEIEIMNQGKSNLNCVMTSVYDINGIEVISKTNNLPVQSKVILNTSLLKPGVYNLMIKSSEFNLNRKIVKFSN